MKSNIQDLAWPALQYGYNATLHSLVETLTKTQYLPLSAIMENQNQQLALLIKHHTLNTPSFAQRLKQAKVHPCAVSSQQGLTRLKPINKGYIQRTGEQFYCQQIPDSQQPVGKAQTSGSTGEPITVMRSMITQIMWEAMAFRDHRWNNRDYGLKLCAIRANIFEEQEQGMWGLPVSRLYDTGASLGMNVSVSIDYQLQRLREFQPGILVVHAGVLKDMVTVWERTGFDLTSLRHIKNIGDTVSDELRDRMRALTGLEIEDNYSSSETGTIAIQCAEGRMFHISSEALIVEILDENNQPCKAGEVGRVVVTDLHNWASPVVRYDLGDYAEVGSGCTCGRTLPTLKRIIGRERNIFYKPDGTRFWPRAGMYKLPDIIPIRQWQMIQHAVDHIEYKLVTDQEPTAEQVEKIQELAAITMGYNPTITVTTTRDLLPRKSNGKFEESICLINQ